MIVLALALQLSAISPPPREIDCPISEIGLSSSTLDALAQSVDESRTDSAATAKAALRTAIGQCASRHGWSKNRSDASAYFITGKVEFLRAKTMLAPFGIGYDLFDNYYSTLPSDQKLAVVRGDASAMMGVIRMLAGNGISFDGWPDDKIRQLGRASGAIFSGRWYTEEAAAAFDDDRPFRSPLKAGS